MRALIRYGPEEGLRRLKKSDPEVATPNPKKIQILLSLFTKIMVK